MTLQEFRELAPPERERLLKRLLPALVIAVLYLSFIGPYLSGLTASAREETQRLRFPQSLEQTRQPLDDERSRLDVEQAGLRKAKASYEQAAGDAIGFLSRPGYADLVVQRLGMVLEQNRMSVITENRAQLVKVQKRLPVSVEEVARFALAQMPGKAAAATEDAAKKDPRSMAYGGKPKEPQVPDITVWTLKIRGSYLNMYRTLRDLNQDPLQVITVMLDMSIPEGAIDPEWNLVLWI